MLRSRESVSTLLFTVPGTVNNYQLGGKVALLGDINGDKKADFAIAAVQALTQTGIVYIHSGANGSLLYTITGKATSERSGYGLADAGDVNGDDIPDFIISAPYAAAGGTNRGEVRVYSGANGAEMVAIKGTTNNHAIGTSVSSAGDLNGDGRPIILLTGEDNFILTYLSP